VTDRQTDGQNYDSQDRVSIATSRGKNVTGPVDDQRDVKSMNNVGVF